MAYDPTNETEEQFRNRIIGERKAWREYSLCLMYPHHVPDDYSDAQVSADLHYLATNHRLPYEIEPEFFDATWERKDDGPKCRQ